jgi:hypothetical protein
MGKHLEADHDQRQVERESPARDPSDPERQKQEGEEGRDSAQVARRLLDDIIGEIGFRHFYGARYRCNALPERGDERENPGADEDRGRVPPASHSKRQRQEPGRDRGRDR